MIRPVAFRADLVLVTTLLLVLGAVSSQAELITYPAPAGASISTAYTVLVNGTKVDIYNIPSVHGGNYSLTYFDFSGSVTIKIKSAKNLVNAIINPVSYNVARSMSGDTLVVVLDKPRKISIEPDEINGPLLIFGNPVEQNVPKQGDPGVLFYGPGVVTANSISVGANQTLYIAGGAVVKGGITINGNNATVRGRGILDGSPWGHEAGPQGNMLIINGVKNTHIEGIILASSYAWTVVPRGADTVNISNIKICGSRVMNDDGIDPVNSRNILIDDCFIRTDDDCIAMKGMNTNSGNVENIVIQNCIFWCDRARMVLLGHESRAPFMRNIVFRNIDAVHVGPDWPMLLLEPGEEMWLQDVTFEDMRFNANGQLVFLQCDPTVNQYMQTQVPGHIRNVHFRNITISSLPKYNAPAYTFNIYGPDASHRVDTVSFEAVVRNGQCMQRTSAGVNIGGNTSNISFTCVAGAFSAMRISPPISNVKPGQTVQFSAQAVDQYGTPVSPQPASFAWSVTGGGTMDAGTGLFTAGAAERSVPDTVKAIGTINGITKAGAAPVLVTNKTILTGIRYYPRQDFNSRMLGGVFEASSVDKDNGPFTTLATITAVPPNGQWGEITAFSSAVPGFKFLRYRAPTGSYGNVAEIEFVINYVKAIGTPFGSPGSYNNSGMDYTKVFDNNVSSYLDFSQASGAYAGMAVQGDATPVVQPATRHTLPSALHVQAEAGALLIGINHSGSHTICVMNVSGALVKSFSGRGPQSYSLDKNETKAGVYLIKAMVDGSETAKRRVIIF